METNNRLASDQLQEQQLFLGHKNFQLPRKQCGRIGALLDAEQVILVRAIRGLILLNGSYQRAGLG